MTKIMFIMTNKSNTHRPSGNTDGHRFDPSRRLLLLELCWGAFFKLAIKFFSGHDCFTAESIYCKVIQERHPTKLLDDSPMLSAGNQ